MPSRFRAAYDARLASGAIKPDPAQAPAVAALARLERELAEARPGGLFRKAEAVRGVYLWGPVGRGKSALMDLFFETQSLEKKRRTHFHVFMAEVQSLVNAWRKGDAAVRQARFGQSRGDDPIAPAAELIARDARLLCFDELQVTDIADATTSTSLVSSSTQRCRRTCTRSTCASFHFARRRLPMRPIP